MLATVYSVCAVYTAGNTLSRYTLSLECASFIERYIIGTHFQRRCQAHSVSQNYNREENDVYDRV